MFFKATRPNLTIEDHWRGTRNWALLMDCGLRRRIAGLRKSYVGCGLGVCSCWFSKPNNCCPACGCIAGILLCISAENRSKNNYKYFYFFIFDTYGHKKQWKRSFHENNIECEGKKSREQSFTLKNNMGKTIIYP